MEAANVETELESVPFTDKESDKISDTVRLDDDVEAPKTDVEESFEFINNGDIGDTNKSDDKNVTDEFVSTSKDVISLDSNVSLDTSDKIVDNSVSNIEETEPGLLVDNDPEQLLTEVSADDENLLDEIHSGSFNASSPLGKSSSNLNRSVQSIEDSYEMLENETLEEEHEEDIEEEEEKDRTNDADTIVLDDDDDDEDNDDGDVDDDSEDEDDHSENSDNDDDESLDGSDKDENHDYGHKDDDISTLSSDGDDIEMISKVPDPKPKIIARKKVVPVHRRLIKKSIKILISSKPKRTMHLKSSSAITVATEHPNGNTETIPTEKTKEAEKMVQMFSNENVEDDDDVCLIEDSPVKVNGKHETEDIESVEQKIKIEQMDIEENIEHEIVDKKEDVETLKTEEVNVELNGVEDDSSSNKLQPPTTTESIVIVAEPVPIITDSSSKEATVPTAPTTVETPAETVSNPKPNHKRSRSTSPTDDVQPTKRLKTELEQTFIGHNKRVQDYIDKTSNNSIDEINNHVAGLLAEVQELHAMAAAKEQEWNNILYLKSVKEEIICRLTRRKSVMEISSSKVGEVEDYTILEQQPSISQKITKENRNSTSINHSANISHSQHAYLRNLSTTEAAKLINSRADMSTSDLDEERVTAAKMHSILFSRNILPKPELAGRSSPTINHLTSLASANMQQIQQQQKAQQQFIEQQQQIYQQQTEHLNGHHQVGRQGAIKDVKSIIEAFRQKNPERAPRRGRRLKGTGDGTVMSPRSADGILSRQSVEGRVSELGLLLGKDRNSRPSSADSSPGNSNLASTNNNISTANANIAFNDMLMQYAKLNERPADLLTNASMIRQQQSGYPEVTLHPVSSQQNTVLHQSDSLQSNSLLHGILTKNTRPSTTYNSFSPTLARLLTAPERITALPNNYRLPSSTPVQSKTSGMNLTKPRNEITITPVMSNPAMHQTILQQQLQRQQDSAARMKFPLMDDEADDSADRLVIDEGDIHNEQSATAGGREFPENEFPKCQGCKKHEAQFVCAGCENQWYCSRICQVSAWDEHCEMCSG
ncbi:MATH and LRR domain-containing protein PFE0570w-like isoform X2 [Bradysia coprophila]|uniref:MATH and LRR domain-containing protein PFE0570w-like isoform X2 n=1 Tax=Bradysia coprophila TaxID=38358 RepID=UPI00187DDA58|nr:MATH and LRR domain-containing protein PFE0570w-like isoform X2 [Bradysia coprophila]